MLEVLEPATPDKKQVHINCHLSLGGASLEITKQLRIYGAEQSGVTIDCNGATINPTYKSDAAIRVQSRRLPDGSYSRPQHVKIRECRTTRAIKVGNGDTRDDTLQSSRAAGHTARMQASAPRYITFDKMTIDVDSGVGFYLSVGTTHVTLQNSEIRGRTRAPAIYLDAESAYNTLRNNKIHKSSQADGPGPKREQLAIDGSAHNTIIGNHFSGLNHGGIYVYRNSGEKGTIRHQKPQFNHIVNNYFYYNNYTGDKQAILIASRMGSREDHNDADAGYPFGSSVSNLDHAKYNVVAENQVRKRSFAKVSEMHDAPNYYFDNITVLERQQHQSGCYTTVQGTPTWLKHHALVTLGTGSAKKTFRCMNHVLIRQP